jgi:hypothetical protein
MKKLAIILLILCSTSPLLAQRADRQYDKEKLEAARVAFITNRINLTASQAEKFWPLFNEHMEERGELMREMSEINRKASDQISDRQATELMEKRFQLQEKMLEREKTFMRSITDVISPAQALQLSNVHRDFTRQLYRMQRGLRGSRHNN